MSEDAAAYFPLFVDLNKKEIVVFGGGKIATRRILSLLDFGADITVVSPACTKEISELSAQNKLVLEQRCYMVGEIKMPYMVLAATNDPIVNDMIHRECKEKGILINVASDQTKSDFFFPGLAVQKPIVIGVTASGKDHKKVKVITQKIRDMLKGE
ncbi:precorrin-2 dehydrogenase/sirohydrochlorin ferrochelatase family protein [Lachnoclostridium phytofermentans]|uniref:precorrin-2 dehydrogenase n=1 Tax=Lachnoclostridium phytofermentans (strain ATCC 700394 / DSM 18823 / ISDg) TaxID=357809 RepID=A9KP82_LACP7|nr:bifunctional precorrin-2 dehydrogenase/sirohydrochlorin ferrochelatase [Lachnoclostridium phytofermentans]ABX41744.1 siroheme synthase [Lachnoclostridium phytofermentans ISDg]